MASAEPPATKETCAGPAAVELKGFVEPAIGCNAPSASSRKPEILPLPPALSTYTRSLYTVTLIGSIPPDDTVDCHCSDPPATVNEVTELLPAFTASNMLLSPDKTTAPWLPRPAPVPLP